MKESEEELLKTLQSLLSLEKAIQSLLTNIVNTQVELKGDLAETNTSLAKLITMLGDNNKTLAKLCFGMANILERRA